MNFKLFAFTVVLSMAFPQWASACSNHPPEGGGGGGGSAPTSASTQQAPGFSSNFFSTAVSGSEQNFTPSTGPVRRIGDAPRRVEEPSASRGFASTTVRNVSFQETAPIQRCTTTCYTGKACGNVCVPRYAPCNAPQGTACNPN